MAHADKVTTIYEGEHIELKRGDGLKWLEDCPSDSLDAVVTDPPYGYNLLDWDEPIQDRIFFDEVSRAIHENGFLAFFGQLPSALPWLNTAKATGWDMLEHVTWVKRHTNPMHRISRSHEEIFIFGKERREFHTVEGPWEDIKLPMVMNGCSSIDGLDRYIKALRKKVEGESQERQRDGAGKNYGSGQISKYKEGTKTDRAPLRCNFTDVWSFAPPGQTERGDGKVEKHPTEKPVAVNERLVKMLVPEGGHVADPFCGRGSLPVAAINVGRKATGIELTDEWSEKAKERVCRMQKDLFKHAP